MKYVEYEQAFSRARLSRYLYACDNNYSDALKLYRYNIQLCQKYYGVLNVFEIVLRNSINEHYKAYFKDPDWIRNQLGPGGLLERHPQRDGVERIINNLIRNGKYSDDRVVSAVSFGFWTHLFSRGPYLLGGQSLLRIFPFRTKGLGQRAIYNDLTAIKSFRNRIAHHGAICFDEAGVKSTQIAQEYFALILKYVQFLGYTKCHLLYGLNTFPDRIIQKIAAL